MMMMNHIVQSNLTQYEAEALGQQFNYTNAFNQQSQPACQRRVIDKLPDIWMETEELKQNVFENRFLEIFYGVRGIENGLSSSNVMLHYSASIAIVHVANYLSKKNLSVSLIEPCFDSLFQVLEHQNIQISPLQEELLHDSDSIYENLVRHVQADALFLVDPNNPTGFTTLGEKNRKSFEEIIRFCKDYDKILIFDHCFASFLAFDNRVKLYDTYHLLEKSGVNYMVIEDTGKFWPIQSTKVGVLKVAKTLYQEMHDIYTSYLLNVSPFVLNFLSAYILESYHDNFYSIRSLLARNREVLKESLKGQILKVLDSDANTSVAWCKIQDSSFKSTDLQRFLIEEKGVHVLPGTFFYWNEPYRGEKYIRIALARDTENFIQGITLLKQGLEEFTKKCCFSNK